MQNLNTVSIEEWEALYKAAIEFYKIRCWEWIYDCDLFGIQNPETEEIGYCSIMGNLGEVLSLNVYLGSEGLRSFWYTYEQTSLAQKGIPVNHHKLLTGLKCLMASFENRSEISKTDLNIISKLGLKFQGKQTWPLFKSYQPGFVPWALKAHEIRFLTIALKESINMALMIKESPNILDSPKEGQYLVRTLKNKQWKNSWFLPAPLPEQKLLPTVDEVCLARLKRSKLIHSGTWEIDCILLPMIIREGERPFYPYGLPILDENGAALFFDVIAPKNLISDVPGKFMEAIQKINRLPKALLIGSKQGFDLLEFMAKELGISIKQVDKLPAVETFLSGMEAYFSNQE